jgi:type IV pilus assembly protein PilA
MNSNFKFKLLSHLKAKKEGEGFTLIELLVVVIIIGVLAAVALPNLLGQVGKARETEGKNAMGTINRSQQSYHFEKAVFSHSLTNSALQATNVLGVIIPASKYYAFAVTGGTSTLATSTALGVAATTTTAGVATPTADNGASQGTRNFGAGIDFVSASGTYNSVICQAAKTGDTVSTITAGTACGSTNDTKVQ